MRIMFCLHNRSLIYCIIFVSLIFLICISQAAFANTKKLETNEVEAKIYNTIEIWVQTLNSLEDLSTVDSIFIDNADIKLVETSSTNYLENIRQRVINFHQGKHSIKSIEIIRLGKGDETDYQVNLIIHWANSTNNEVARFQEKIRLSYRKQSGQFLIEGINEKFIMPDDGLGSKLKC